jgi:nicotinate-nucleotide pyrophosphorylase (carboxylating)
MVQRVAEFGTRIVCTRKTTPGLRSLEKYAVRAGGGYNHRFGLDDAVLIKENHIAVAGSISEAITRARSSVGHMVKIEVEVETIVQLKETLEFEVDVVLLDNMAVETVREAVELTKGRVLTEVSGGITPENAVPLAAAGVDLLSAGYLTHSSPALDITFEILPC